MEPTKPRRRWLKFSLGGLLLAITLLCLLLGWQADRVARQRRAVEMVERLGGHVAYEHQWYESPPFSHYNPQIESRAPLWLRELVGEDWFRTVALVSIERSSKTLSEDDISQLAGFRRLRQLSLRSQVTDGQLEHIATLSELETFRCDGERITDQGLMALSRLGKLRELEIVDSEKRDTPFTERGIRYLARLDKLTSLAVGAANVDDDDLAQLAALKQIKLFSIDYPAGSAARFEWLKQWPKCQALVLSGVRVTDEGWDALATCKTLESLWFTNSTVTDEGLSRLKDLHLVSLGLMQTQVSASAITQLKHLQFLELWQNEVDLATIESLDQLPQLEHLDLRGAKIRDDVLAKLPPLPKMFSLWLSQAPIGDAALAGINQQPKLRYLYLNETQVTDAGLASLTKGLSHVDVSHTNVTEVAAEQFRKSTGAEVVMDTELFPR